MTINQSINQKEKEKEIKIKIKIKKKRDVREVSSRYFRRLCPGVQLSNWQGWRLLFTWLCLRSFIENETAGQDMEGGTPDGKGFRRLYSDIKRNGMGKKGSFSVFYSILLPLLVLFYLPISRTWPDLTRLDLSCLDQLPVARRVSGTCTYVERQFT